MAYFLGSNNVAGEEGAAHGILVAVGWTGISRRCKLTKQLRESCFFKASLSELMRKLTK